MFKNNTDFLCTHLRNLLWRATSSSGGTQPRRTVSQFISEKKLKLKIKFKTEVQVNICLYILHIKYCEIILEGILMHITLSLD